MKRVCYRGYTLERPDANSQWCIKKGAKTIGWRHTLNRAKVAVDDLYKD